MPLSLLLLSFLLPLSLLLSFLSADPSVSIHAALPFPTLRLGEVFKRVARIQIR